MPKPLSLFAYRKNSIYNCPKTSKYSCVLINWLIFSSISSINPFNTLSFVEREVSVLINPNWILRFSNLLPEIFAHSNSLETVCTNACAKSLGVLCVEYEFLNAGFSNAIKIQLINKLLWLSRIL